MKAQTEQELVQLIKEHRFLLGSHLEQFRYDEKALQLLFSKTPKKHWLTFSMAPGAPFIFVTDQRLHLIKNLKKPLSLFLKTHFEGLTLTDFTVDLSLGRFLRLSFEEDRELELVLIPGRTNVLAHLGSKRVAAFKPKPIPPKTTENLKAGPIRSSAVFVEHWQKTHSKSFQAYYETPDVNKQLQKKQNGLEKMKESLERLQSQPWGELGEWLKSHQRLSEVPPNFQTLLDPSQALAWNISRCFEQDKKNQSKIAGTKLRITELMTEIERLKKGEVDLKSQRPEQKSLLAEAKAKGRTLRLDGSRLFIGRSGQENLQLLRKAKPWYLWLHIRDYPGAYGILEKHKTQMPTDAVLRQAGEAVIKASLPKGAQGQYQLIYAECRYVRPIKGAKSGQVTYSHEKVIGLKV